MKYQEEKSMKAKMIKVTATVANGILCVVQAVGTNLWLQLCWPKPIVLKSSFLLGLGTYKEI